MSEQSENAESPLHLRYFSIYIHNIIGEYVNVIMFDESSPQSASAAAAPNSTKPTHIAPAMGVSVNE